MEDVPELIVALRSGDVSEAELASRTLRKLAQSGACDLFRWRKEFLKQAINASELRVRWNLILILGKLPFAGAERGAAVDWLFERLADASPFSKTFALQSLMDLSAEDARLRTRVLCVAQEFAETGTAAMRARARKLLKQAGF